MVVAKVNFLSFHLQVKAEMERGNLSRAASAGVPAQIPIKTRTQISPLSPRVFFGYFYIINGFDHKRSRG